VVIATIIFIYTMSLVSSQNICSGVRSFQCEALQKEANDEALAQQQAEFVQLVQNTPVVAPIQAIPVTTKQKPTTVVTPQNQTSSSSQNTQQA